MLRVYNQPEPSAAVAKKLLLRLDTATAVFCSLWTLQGSDMCLREADIYIAFAACRCC